MKTAPFLATIVLTAALASPIHAKDITRCGQTIAKGETGILQNDLDCPSLPGSCYADESIACTTSADCPQDQFPVAWCSSDPPRLAKGARLQLNGHILTGSNPEQSQRWALLTDGATIEGPGEITSPGGVGIILGGNKLVLRDLTIRDSFYGVYVAQRSGSVDATNVHVVDNESLGLYGGKRVTGSNIVVSGNGFNTGLPPGSVFGFGVAAKTVRVDGLTATGNVGPGVWASSVRLKNSTISGNNGFVEGIDIAARRKPRLTATTCGESGRLSKIDELIGTWGVCSAD